ncbi:MAG: hypothetical protein V1747_00455 [Candidatus Omnitrophota bacterium]
MSQRILRKICFISLGVLVFLGINKQSFALSDQLLFGNNTGLLIEAQTDRMIYKVDQEVIITVYIKNKTEDVIELIEPAIAPESFMFEIVAPDRKKDKLLNIYGLKLETIRLYPKKRIKFTAKFLPETPGNYDINIKYNGFKTKALTVPSMRVFVVGNLPETSKDEHLAVE